MTDYLVANNIKKTYIPKGQSPIEALQGVSLNVKQGEMIAIMGVSGSGKSTLLHILGFLDKASEGQLFFKTQISSRASDRELARLRNQEVGFVLQDFALIPYRTAYENIEVPMIFAKKKRKERKYRIEELLAELDIPELRDRRVSQMSGGQKQRVAIARAMANDPALLLADEPTGALDSHTKQEIMKILQQIHKDGKTIIIVTHDPEVAAMADRRIHIIDGLLVDEGQE
jgi:putative ABC transport system ATP-binding protein